MDGYRKPAEIPRVSSPFVSGYLTDPNELTATDSSKETQMNRFRPALESLDDRSLPSLFWFAGLFAGGWETLADAKDAVDDDQSRIQLELE